MIFEPVAACSSRPKRFAPTLMALGLLLFAAPFGMASGQSTSTPNLYQALKAPRGNKLVLRTVGVGVQIYRWNGSSWNFVAPEATLFASEEVVAIHFKGPTWESLSGSREVGAVVNGETPNPEAIPWLLLRAASNSGRGIFRNVTYVQRLNTIGGIAPTTPGTSVGEEAPVSYAARYLFYKQN